MARDDRRRRAEDRPPPADLHGSARARLRAAGRPLSLSGAYRVTVRRGSRVERRRIDSLTAALDEVETVAREVARTERPGAVNLGVRRFERSARVAARIELSGPGRLSPSVRAGLDVHGDGSMVAHVGRSRRTAVEAADGETALQALRRVLSG